MSTINLLPEDYVRRRTRHRANVLCLVLFACVMGGVLAAQAVSELSLRHTRQILDRVNADYAEAARLIEQMRQLEAQECVLRQRAELTASLIERVPRSTLLAVVANALPPEASLVNVDLQVERTVRRSEGRPGLPGPGGAASAEEVTTTLVMEITGLAPTDVEVAGLIANLARSPLIATVDLVYSQEKLTESATVREFRVRAELRCDADALDLKAPGEPRRAQGGDSGPTSGRPA